MHNIICVIPARYQSSRFPGKPLADIHGKPMIWWVYQQAKKISLFERIVVATDDEKIISVCGRYHMEAVMTGQGHRTHVERVHELSEKIHSKLYVCVCGDEPLTMADTIAQVIPDGEGRRQEFIARTLMREFNDPAEMVDPSNIKVVANMQGDCLLLTRSIVPFPYKSVNFKYKKLVGIECFSKKALDYFVGQPVGVLEEIEDVTLLRYVENRMPVQLVMTDAHQLGVDTPKDLERARALISKYLEDGTVSIPE